MNIECNNMTYNMVAQLLGEIWFDTLDLSFWYTKRAGGLLPGFTLNFKEMRLTQPRLNEWFDVVDNRCKKYILETCPHVTVDMLKAWRAEAIQKILQPFNWILWPDYQRLMTVAANFRFETFAQEIISGEFGTWPHKAAA